MRGGKPFRRAVAASIGAHVLIAAILAIYFGTASESPRPALRLNTRATVQLGFLPDDPTPDREEPVVPMPLPDGRSSVAEVTPMSRVSVVEPLPISHPDGRGSVSQPAPVQQAAATIPAAPAWALGGTAVHGPLASDQAIVYLLDASGSMGEWGKFDAARGALVATLRLQPPSVRYQVVIYAGTATILLRGAPGECLPATPGNLARTIAALEALPAPVGRSNHVEGLRTALTLHPDLVLIFTDGDDLPALALRNVRKQAARPATVCLARVNGDRVEAPLEVK